MSTDAGPEPLTAREYAVAALILAALGDEVLADQLPEAQVTHRTATTIELGVAPSVPASTVDDGPLDVAADVLDGDELTGEVLVWVSNGRLSGLEYAWYTDHQPDEWPSPDQLRVRGA